MLMSSFLVLVSIESIMVASVVCTISIAVTTTVAVSVSAAMTITIAAVAVSIATAVTISVVQITFQFFQKLLLLDVRYDLHER